MLYVCPSISEGSPPSSFIPLQFQFQLILWRKFMQGALVRCFSTYSLEDAHDRRVGVLFLFSFRFPPRGICRYSMWRKCRLHSCSYLASELSFCLVLCLWLVSRPIPIPIPIRIRIRRRVSICKWCISGREMLLMIYLHLALIYANVLPRLPVPPAWLPFFVLVRNKNKNQNRKKNVLNRIEWKKMKEKKRFLTAPGHGIMLSLAVRPVGFSIFHGTARQHQKKLLWHFFFVPHPLYSMIPLSVPGFSLKSFLFAFRDFEQTDNAMHRPPWNGTLCVNSNIWFNSLTQ